MTILINNVVLVGRLTKDPDLRYTASGTAVATFTLAVNRNFTNQSGNREAEIDAGKHRNKYIPLPFQPLRATLSPLFR